MALTRWTPISDLVSLHNAMDRLFSESLAGTGRSRTEALTTVGEGYLPLDVYQTDKEWVVRASLPGADPQSVEVTCDGNTIKIKGEIKWPEGAKSENYWLRENFYGKFSRQITLPEEAMCDQSKAEFHDGMLVLTVPKSQPSKTQPKKIPVIAGTTHRQVESHQPVASTAKK
jgi:HSP20 family protein